MASDSVPAGTVNMHLLVNNSYFGRFLLPHQEVLPKYLRHLIVARSPDVTGVSLDLRTPLGRSIH